MGFKKYISKAKESYERWKEEAPYREEQRKIKMEKLYEQRKLSLDREISIQKRQAKLRKLRQKYTAGIPSVHKTAQSFGRPSIFGTLGAYGNNESSGPIIPEESMQVLPDFGFGANKKIIRKKK